MARQYRPTGETQEAIRPLRSAVAGDTPSVTTVRPTTIFDEAHTADGEVRPHYAPILRRLRERDPHATAAAVRDRLVDEGCTFGEGEDCDAFAVDVVPRLIGREEWDELACGLEQRVRALDAFVTDVYRGRSIVRDGVVPERVLREAEYFEPELTGLPPQPVLVALAGLDVIRTPDGEFQVLEDNLRTPSGLAYAFAARRAVAGALGADDALPLEGPAIDILGRALRGGRPDARLALLSDGPENTAYWEHSMLARMLDIPLVTLDELDLDTVDVVYRRTDDDRLRDPRTGAYTAVGGALADGLRDGRVSCVNALGNGVADDKLVHAYVEDMVRYYLGEEPRVRSVPTYDLDDADALEEVLDRLETMVVKPRAAYGGEGVFVGPRSTAAERGRVAATVRAHPEAWIAQETVFFSTHPTLVDGTLQPRHVDLRAFVTFDGETAEAIPRRPDAGRLRRGRARRQLVAGRRGQGHVGAGRHEPPARSGRAGPGADKPQDARRRGGGPCSSTRHWRSRRSIDVLPRLPPSAARLLGDPLAAIELRPAHTGRSDASPRLRPARRRSRARELRAGCSGRTLRQLARHEVAGADRHQAVEGSMRALARREPTFALHVHVGVPTPAGAVAALNQVRAHLPLLLALSANSPYWQGRDTGLASARTPLFQAFPRVGIPRVFSSYADWVRSVDLLIASKALPDHTYLWWDARLQPRYGTLEVRIMDAQVSVEQTAALVALVQCLVRLEVLEGFASSRRLHAQEVLEENRFLAARDGARAELIDPDRGTRVPVSEIAHELVEACRPHAADLGCAEELGLVCSIVDEPGAERQRALAGPDDDQRHLVGALAEAFCPVGAAV
jgi:carboxylate-amine ligase